MTVEATLKIKTKNAPMVNQRMKLIGWNVVAVRKMKADDMALITVSKGTLSDNYMALLDELKEHNVASYKLIK